MAAFFAVWRMEEAKSGTSRGEENEKIFLWKVSDSASAILHTDAGRNPGQVRQVPDKKQERFCGADILRACDLKIFLILSA